MSELREKLGWDGCIVWARIKEKSALWPAIIVPPHMCGKDRPNDNLRWLFWFGDHRISLVRMKNVFAFNVFISKVNPKNTSKSSFADGCYEAVKCIRDRSNWGSSDKLSRDDLFQWCLTHLHNGNYLKWGLTTDGAGRVAYSIPTLVADFLKTLKLSAVKELFRVKTMQEVEDAQDDPDLLKKKKSGFQRRKKRDVQKLCLSCYKQSSNLKRHIFFQGLLCQPCHEEFTKYFFDIDVKDNKKTSCFSCGDPGSLHLCDRESCFGAFCSCCMDNFMPNYKLHYAGRKNLWMCFFCLEHPGIFKKQDNWVDNMKYMYRQPEDISFPNVKIAEVLFVAKGSDLGSICAENIGIKVARQHVVTINTKTIQYPAQYHYRGMTSNFESINSISPQINFIFSSISSVNLKWTSDKSDVNSLEEIFFEFFRLISERKKTGDIFWIFEGPACISHIRRETISRFLEVQPYVIDLRLKNCLTRYRLAWSNLPDHMVSASYFLIRK